MWTVVNQYALAPVGGRPFRSRVVDLQQARTQQQSGNGMEALKSPHPAFDVGSARCPLRVSGPSGVVAGVGT
jgi:hypothetical protein